MGVPIQKLDQKHSEYSLYCDAWSQFEVLSAQGVRLEMAAQNFLIKRPKELFDVYAERIRRFTAQPILANALGWYQSALFRRNPTIEIKGGDDWYENEFLKNSDRIGTTYVDAYREAFKYLFLYQKAYILTDLPHPEVEPESYADQKAMGLEPYIVTYSPRAVINWSNDNAGNLEWIVIRTEQEISEFLQAPTVETLWYYFDRQNYSIYRSRQRPTNSSSSSPVIYDATGRPAGEDAEADLIAEGQHALAKQNRVPVRRLQVSEEMWLANRAYLLLKAHINQDNALDWALFNNNLAMPVIYSDKQQRSTTFSEVALLQLGEKDRMEWLESTGRSFEISASRLDSLREEAYRSMYLQAQGKSSSATASAQSGYSKEMDMMPSNEALNYFGDIIRAGMQVVGQDVSAARGQDGVEWDVFGFVFETKPITQSIAVAQELDTLGIFQASPTLERETMKMVAHDFLEDRNETIKKQVDSEIDQMKTSQQKMQEMNAVQQQQDQAFQTSFQRLTSKSAVNAEQASLAS